MYLIQSQWKHKNSVFTKDISKKTLFDEASMKGGRERNFEKVPQQNSHGTQRFHETSFKTMDSAITQTWPFFLAQPSKNAISLEKIEKRIFDQTRPSWFLEAIASKKEVHGYAKNLAFAREVLINQCFHSWTKFALEFDKIKSSPAKLKRNPEPMKTQTLCF